MRPCYVLLEGVCANGLFLCSTCRPVCLFIWDSQISLLTASSHMDDTERFRCVESNADKE